MCLSPFSHIVPRGRGIFKLKSHYIKEYGSTLYLKHDRVMAPFINRFGYWDYELSTLIISQINKISGKTVFIDIGANQGIVSMQVARQINNQNIKFICIEPSLDLFHNLKKNIESSQIDCDLYNFGLGDKSDSSIVFYKSKRNATSTQHLNATLDPIKDLTKEKGEIVAVDKFIDLYSGFKNYENIIIKSDTDGSDIIIFNSFLNNQNGKIINSYALEVLLINVTHKQRIEFIINCLKFSSWTLLTRERKKIREKNILIKLIIYSDGFIGDLFLSNGSH